MGVEPKVLMHGTFYGGYTTLTVGGTKVIGWYPTY